MLVEYIVVDPIQLYREVDLPKLVNSLQTLTTLEVYKIIFEAYLRNWLRPSKAAKG